ncbi:HD domain-containing protein [Clostridium cellulovorans]|uniref:Metal-dependent hydrolase HDOD n=1 Tax=Clostridium cellulovorans (strain ATCC 35296 / DSM 3052 / OCM 3 / 743B) TaxID=573061 RepID=D9SWB7_CLOC7|nr:HD domain-containing protein [Clostridium cellulovorans]ADL51261.1 Metal-dependent hydrolase HDOD [Clostridium cellulovorans 743B]
MSNKYPSKAIAQETLKEAEKLNKGQWVQHAEYVALACKNIAEHCEGLDSEKAYVLGLLHDIGRRVGIVKEKHTIAGYDYCISQGWDDVAKICITHSYSIQDIKSVVGEMDMSKEEYDFIENYLDSIVYDDYDLLVQLCDALALPTGFCLMEQRLVDIARRYGFNQYTLLRWEELFKIKEYFEDKIGSSIYQVLPGAAENTFGLK